MPVRRILAPLAVCLPLLACDGSGEARQIARWHVGRGDLDAAMAALEGARGSEVDRLRLDIQRASEHRVQVRGRVDLMLGRLGPATAGSTRAELRRMLDAEWDPGTRELLERTLSDLTDLLAERARSGDATRRNAARAPPEAQPVQPAAASSGAGSGRERMMARLRSDVKVARAAGEWSRGLALIALLAEREGVAEGEVRDLRMGLVADARIEISRLLAEAWELERSEGPRAGLERLEKEAGRFPEEGALTHFHLELAELRRMAEERKVADAALEEEAFISLVEIDVEGVALEADAESDELARLARERLGAGDLAGARTLLLAAAQRERPGPQRDDWIGQARDLKGRLALRGELLDAHRADPDAWREMGVLYVDEDGWSTGAGPLAWEGVPIERLVLAARGADLSPAARRGLFCEQLASGDARHVELALVGLARAVKKSELGERDAANLVSRLRAGTGDRRDYVLADGEWTPASAVAARERSAAATRLEGALVYAGADGRDGALDALVSELGAEAAGVAVRVRMSTALKTVRSGGTVGQLERLAARREELDVLRGRALRLIFDEETYFYPYDPPEPPRTAEEYALAQREVDQAVAAVRAVWDNGRPVALSEDFRGAVEELAWCLSRLEHLGLDGELPPDLPPWITALPGGLAEVALDDFAWSAEEARELAQGRRVRARNARLFESARSGFAELNQDALPSPGEREQVRVTNDYRVLLGRRVLAWNPLIQVAAQGHSDYMADVGDFGHFEEDPERRSVVDRLKLVDYHRGGNENVARNGGGARGVHDGWLQSSGHHRNILARGHLEMASAVSGLYWTQNFGRDDSFKEDL